MPEQRCETCGAFLLCERCLRPIKANARVAIVHGDGQCHAQHVPDCLTASWSMAGCALWFAATMLVLLVLDLLVQAGPDGWQAIARLLPH